MLFLANLAKADLNISLKDYLEGKDLDKGSTQIYLLKRCSAVYAYASGIVLKSDAISSKNLSPPSLSHPARQPCSHTVHSPSYGH